MREEKGSEAWLFALKILKLLREKLCSQVFCHLKHFSKKNTKNHGYSLNTVPGRKLLSICNKVVPKLIHKNYIISCDKMY